MQTLNGDARLFVIKKHHYGNPGKLNTPFDPKRIVNVAKMGWESPKQLPFHFHTKLLKCLSIDSLTNKGQSVLHF